MGLENRLKAAKAAIATVDQAELPPKARLTFRGRPVIGSYGASAEFIAKASVFFTDAFAAVVAGMNENLRYMGPIPDKAKNQLLITGTAIGSFGLEFELPRVQAESTNGQSDMFPEALKPENRPEIAMQKLEKLFQVAAEGSDDDIAELVDLIHQRAVKKASEFLDYLSDQDAWCGLEFQESVFRFGGVKQVRDSAARLKSNNIKESEETFRGEFQGVLPKSRAFEFRVIDQDHILRGKVGPEIEDADELNKLVHAHLSAKFHVIQVGQGRPRYTLKSMADVTRQ
jgi:hypothetical protein